MDAAVDAELLRREVIAAALRVRAEERGGAIPLSELADFELPDGSRQRLFDPGKGGIWNPKDFRLFLPEVGVSEPAADEQHA